MDYRVYRKNIWFWCMTFAISAGMGGVAGYLFYGTWFAVVLIPVCIPVVYGRLYRYCIRRQKRQLRMEFCEVMTLVSGSLNAGYSLENALIQVLKTSGAEFPVMNLELMIMVNGISCHKKVEALLAELADRSDVKEIMEFSNMIGIAKRYGGNIPYLIRQLSAQRMREERVETEIQTAIAAKRLEGYIMLLVPFGIVLFLKITNPSYVQILYNTIAGRICMTAALTGIGICACWIEKIIRIEV